MCLAISKLRMAEDYARGMKDDRGNYIFSPYGPLPLCDLIRIAAEILADARE